MIWHHKTINFTSKLNRQFKTTNSRQLFIFPIVKIILIEAELRLFRCKKPSQYTYYLYSICKNCKEGAVDDLSQILELQETFQRRGLTFYIHIDGAWGGYFASVLWNRRMQRCTAGRQSVKQSGMIIGRNRKPNSWDGQMYSGPPNFSNNPVLDNYDWPEQKSRTGIGQM